MRIMIDTRHDSSDQIRKVIRMLQHLVGEEVKTNVPPSPDLMGMFNAPKEDVSKVKEESEETPQVEFF